MWSNNYINLKACTLFVFSNITLLEFFMTEIGHISGYIWKFMHVNNVYSVGGLANPVYAVPGRPSVGVHITRFEDVYLPLLCTA